LEEVAKDQLNGQDVPSILKDFGSLGLIVHSSEDLAPTAWSLATRLRRTFYDSLYLALAESQACPLVTADRRLFNAVSPSGFNLVWIQDIV
jgi:predicted nucleic acid-binding protein